MRKKPKEQKMVKDQTNGTIASWRWILALTTGFLSLRVERLVVATVNAHRARRNQRQRLAWVIAERERRYQLIGLPIPK